MSALGPSGLPAISLAQALANLQRVDSASARSGDAASAADPTRQASVGRVPIEVSDVASSSDRDPDGRAIAGEPDEPGDENDSPSGEKSRARQPRRRLPPDPRGRLGRQLDFEA